MAITVYQYPRCDTCRKALKWLSSKGLAHQAIDIVEQPPSAARLGELWRASGLPIASFFNTAGESYRAGGFKDRLATMSDDEKLAALAADGKLIKRPLLVDERAGGMTVLVGFREPAWGEALSGASAR